MRRSALLLTAAAAATLAGCDLVHLGKSGDPQAPVAETAKMPGMGAADDANSGGGATVKLVVTLRLTTIEVPSGTASGSEEIWSYLDEEPVRAIRSANLGRNGFRVGLGRLDTWPDLARVFKRMTGRSPKQNMVATIPGDPLPVVLKERQEDQTIFTFHDDRTLSGRDYPPGDYLLSVVCTLDEDDLSKVLVTAMPQVRAARRRTRYVLGRSGPQVLAEAEVHPFPELAFRLMVPARSFLVIGPGASARNPMTPGHHFLAKEREGMEFETLLVVVPEVLATPVR